MFSDPSFDTLNDRLWKTVKIVSIVSLSSKVIECLNFKNEGKSINPAAGSNLTGTAGRWNKQGQAESYLATM